LIAIHTEPPTMSDVVVETVDLADAVETVDLPDAAAQVLDEAIAEEREAELPFRISLAIGQTSALELEKAENKCADIFQYDRNIIYNDNRIYLHPTKYKSMNGFSSTDDGISGWEELRNDLAVAFIEQGEVVVANGGGKQSRYLICQRNRIYKKGKEKKDVADQQEFRGTALHNDYKRNSRGPAGKKFIRRTSTSRATTTGDQCNFSVHILFDECGFYFKGGKRKAVHCNRKCSA
jgi:hypothetical protein